MRDLHAAGAPISGRSGKARLRSGGVAGSKGRFPAGDSTGGDAAGNARADDGGRALQRRECDFVSRGTDLVGVAGLCCRAATRMRLAVGRGLSLVCGASALFKTRMEARVRVRGEESES